MNKENTIKYYERQRQNYQVQMANMANDIDRIDKILTELKA